MDLKQAVETFKGISFRNCIQRSYMGCMREDQLTSITKLQQFLNRGYTVCKMSNKNGSLVVEVPEDTVVKRVIVESGIGTTMFSSTQASNEE
ncbi:MAG: hypothetical protein IJ075_04335 [Lachnospiraceae bacterium]|nr:hypothetical protein [Lachnospiraceae bacterium]